MPADYLFPLLPTDRDALAAILNDLVNHEQIEGWWWMDERSTKAVRVGFCSKEDAGLAAVYWMICQP